MQNGLQPSKLKWPPSFRNIKTKKPPSYLGGFLFPRIRYEYNCLRQFAFFLYKERQSVVDSLFNRTYQLSSKSYRQFAFFLYKERQSVVEQ